jgi:uncharacterized protein DUF1996
MRRYVVVAVTTVLGIGVVVGAGAAAAAFGSQGSSRSFVRVAHKVKPNTAFKPVKSLARLRGANFVSGCRFSHRNTDDPIVFPAEPGKSHDHTFIGNDTTNAFSTVDSLRRQTSSCRRPGDTAAYWVPTLIGPEGEVIVPRAATVYYRRHTLDAVRPFPQGFKVIAGNAKATAPQGVMVTSWNCGPVAGIPPTSTIPTCPDAGQRSLTLHVQFPNCWDGVNLDSADHHSHMAYSMRGRCPSSHPVAMSAIQINLRYPTAGGPGLVLASGGQFSGHADFFNAWRQGVLRSLVDGCLNALRRCQQGF